MGNAHHSVWHENRDVTLASVKSELCKVTGLDSSQDPMHLGSAECMAMMSEPSDDVIAECDAAVSALPAMRRGMRGARGATCAPVASTMESAMPMYSASVVTPPLMPQEKRSQAAMSSELKEDL